MYRSTIRVCVRLSYQCPNTVEVQPGRDMSSTACPAPSTLSKCIYELSTKRKRRRFVGSDEMTGASRKVSDLLLDHDSSSEVDKVNTALVDALAQNQKPGALSGLTTMLGKLPGTQPLTRGAEGLHTKPTNTYETLRANAHRRTTRVWRARGRGAI
ncbi:hypothetical protein K469DRAFT_696277 [Zopfia rhizophila CBS 207.26]|uniref:Uncharacterized protein n=1 Tax=Zopfia rhizophila CBS 207.26 TaxID=1314779 RepID=A0A6A6DG03_9PEZI|nr:hypothetical protein K469DRAFT_696277 [Zopfia rhizophila CBS 207.26]